MDRVQSADSAACASSAIGPVPAWVADGGFIIIAIGIMVMFWGMAFICEEYCIPAITVFCKRNNISEDVAGAIFIGTGLSMPVLFASFIGLFISNSAIGVGTVVGGDIFNHLINIAVSIHSAPSRTLKLNGTVFTRESAIYLISCVLVIWAAKGNLNRAFQNMLLRNEWTSCLTINWLEALVLVFGYVLYCCIEAYFGRIAPYLTHIYVWCVKARRERMMYSQPSRTSDVGSDDGIPDLASRESVSSEVGRRRRRTNSSEILSQHHEHNLIDLEMATIPPAIDGLIRDSNMIDVSDIPEEPSIDLGSHIAQLPQSIMETADQISLPTENTVNLEDFTMFIRSSFFAAHAIGCIPNSRAWKMRYFTLDHSGLYYRLEYHQPRKGTHVRFIDVFDLDDIQITNYELFEFRIRLRTMQKAYYFRSMEQTSFQAVVQKLTDFLHDIKKRNESELRAMALKSMIEISDGQDVLADPDNESIGDTFFVPPVALVPKIIYYGTLPLKVLIYLTTPDVRKLGRENKALLSIFTCLAWLALVTYILVVGLGLIANLLRINSAIMGLTLGTWAASYPALWSSVVVARSGYGDMAVCNALGSNIFNNFLGLGLPWLVYVVIYNKPYAALEDDGVVLSLVGLMVILVATYILLALTNWTLKSWMVPLFTVVYFAYIIYFVYFTVTL